MYIRENVLSYDESILKKSNTIYLEITDRCNLNCSYCYNNSSGNKKWFKKLERVKEIIINARLKGVNSITISGGEPFLHPDLYEILDFITKEKMRGLIITNGTLITKKYVDYIKDKNIQTKISVDTINPKKYKNIQSLNWDVISLIKDKISFSTVIYNQTKSDILSLLKEFRIKGIENIEVNVAIINENFKKKSDLEKLLVNQIKILKEVIDFKLANGIDIKGQHISVPIRNYLLDRNSNLLNCSLCSEVKIDKNEDIYPCPLFSKKENIIGNISENIEDLDKVNLSKFCKSLFFKHYNRKCLMCDYAKLCKAGCYANNVENIFQEAECRLNYAIYEHIDNKFKARR